MKKIVIASDSFKGTLSSKEISDIFESVIKEYRSDIIVNKVVLGDGGENTLEVFSNNFPNGKYHHLEVAGPNYNKITAKYYTYDDIAVIELAEASGLNLATTKNPKITTTYGMGELILDAYKKGYKNFYIALGGSSSTDGGCGLLSALGIKFLNKEGKEFIPVGETLSHIKYINNNDLLVKDAQFVILSDVNNPMYGPHGAAYVFAKQKGANEEDIKLLDGNLKYLNNLFIENAGKHVDNIPGSGAAGATSSGMLTYFNATIVSGIEKILDLISFDSIIKDADYLITGEGKLDQQSFNGKLISGVLKHTEKMNVPTICICGSLDEGLSTNEFFDIYQTNIENKDFEYVKKHAQEMYINSVKALLKKINLLK